jgi:hypothetical protein
MFCYTACLATRISNGCQRDGWYIHKLFLTIKK